MSSTTSSYQSEIDGLRAVAVLAVLLFHLDVPGFSGGFVGVDVFFVISGYLITKNIIRDLEAEQFELKDFYLRRIYRLFPALFATVAATLVASFFILTPEHFLGLGKASVASVLSTSNILFWSESGYFDEAKVFKPLLHTWSLGVEEQFYLLWPLLLIYVYSMSSRLRYFSIVLLGLASLFAAQAFLTSHNAMVFYWMPFRISEFATGAVLVFLRRPACTAWQASFAAVLGALLILGPVTLYSDQTLFPGIMAIVPCLGTALLIRFGYAGVVFTLLDNPISRQLGKISYSLYLVHWPVIVLVSYWKLGGIGAKSLLFVIPIIFLLAYILHYQVEQRFREPAVKRPGAGRGYAITLSAIVLLLLGASIFYGKGWMWRYSDEAKVVINALSDLSNNDEEKRRLLDQYQASFQNQKSTNKEYIIGDSFAEDTMLALKLSTPHLNLGLLKIPAKCQPILPGNYDEPESVSMFCNDKRETIFDNPDLKDAATIYLAASWREPALSRLVDTVGFLKAHTSAKVVVIGPRASFHDVPTLAIRYAKREGLSEFVDRYKSPLVFQNIEKLREAARGPGVEFVNVFRLMCPDDVCVVISPADGKLIYSDHAHLTISGATYLGQRLVKELRLK